MKQVALLFALAVIAPSLALAWLAARSLRDQQSVLERQEEIVCQQIAEAIGREVRTSVYERQQELALHVEQLLTIGEPTVLAMDFDRRIREVWPLAQVGFAVALEGDVLSPSMWNSPQALQFRMENDRFLCSRESIEVVWKSAKGPVKLGLPDGAPGLRPARDSCVYATRTGVGMTFRPDVNGGTHFRQIIADAPSGTMARFLQDELNLLFWYRSPRDTNLVYGVRVNLPDLVESLAPVVRRDALPDPAFAAVLRDEAGRAVAATRDGLTPGALAPFVAVPLGELLPHWDVAVFLLDPQRHARGAATVRTLVGWVIGVSLLAIAGGSWLIVADLRRQLALARQKTDFVSNVSHELKTPLTSIRMFSEMLAEGRVREPQKQVHFLRIIAAEAARLTRLINNVLDFARLERGDKQARFAPLDLRALVQSTVETFRPSAEAAGFAVTCRLPREPLTVNGDRDALAQVLLNLLSNAEKYSGDRKEISVELACRGSGEAELSVHDRGVGVPVGCEERIFEQFFRGNDSLSSGIQGSGLGLTLARQMARLHGGEITLVHRDGGGSSFIVRLPALAGPGAVLSRPPAISP